MDITQIDQNQTTALEVLDAQVFPYAQLPVSSSCGGHHDPDED